ncbi:MAG: helix-turn-helix domain-containing protein [Cyclobacteriaceae bacterium]
MENVLTGIQFLLGLQLIAVALIQFVYRENTTKFILAFFCLVLGIWFFELVFFENRTENLLLFLTAGPEKFVLVAPLLLVYFQSYRKTINSGDVTKQLVIPIIYFCALMTTRLLFANDLLVMNKFVVLSFQIVLFLLFIHYFFVVQKELTTEIKKYFIPKAHKKIVFLFYSLFFFLLLIPVWNSFEILVNADAVAANNYNEDYPLSGVFIILGKLIPLSTIYFHILGYILFLYALSESLVFKKLFLPKDIAFEKSSIENTIEIEKVITNYLIEEEHFKDEKLTIESCAKAISITKKELHDYLKITNKGTFNDYLKNLRVEQFKLLLQNDNLNHYDLVGLAKECGFKSKSTFFRVFKEAEGITPNEYKKGIA